MNRREILRGIGASGVLAVVGSGTALAAISDAGFDGGTTLDVSEFGGEVPLAAILDENDLEGLPDAADLDATTVWVDPEAETAAEWQRCCETHCGASCCVFCYACRELPEPPVC